MRGSELRGNVKPLIIKFLMKDESKTKLELKKKPPPSTKDSPQDEQVYEPAA